MSSEIIRYNVPQTSMLLVIYTGTPVDSVALRTTIDSCLSAAHTIIDKHGDVFMFPDPCTFKMPPERYTGLEIWLQSTIVPGLKWIEVLDALNGVRQVILQRAIYKEAHIKIVDDHSGKQMGVVDLTRSPAVNPAAHSGLA